jgi:ABC-type oligopeptide transport system ATPase subunit
MVLEPKFVLLDEPTSALDMSVQAQIVDLLRDLQRRHDLAYLFISHDLKVVRALVNYVVVLKNGKVIEEGRPTRSSTIRKRPTPRLCSPPPSTSPSSTAPRWRRKQRHHSAGWARRRCAAGAPFTASLRPKSCVSPRRTPA